MVTSALLFLLSVTSTLCSPISSSSVPDCCEYLEDPVELIQCVSTSSDAVLKESDKPAGVSFVVFASESIYNYASSTLLINSYYAEARSYTIKFLNEDTKSDFFPEDKRWNKIGSVLDALKPDYGWAKDTEFLVAIDADLIVMDRSLDIKNIAAANPKAHIIMSSDPSDVANTGFIIVRNTKWAFSFFETWWETRHSFDCDQHAFNDLYSKIMQTKKSRNKIAILPAGDINSEFPVYSTFDDTSKVLHMVGEHNEIRYEVFSRAAQGLCSNFSLDDADDSDGFDEDSPSVPSTTLGHIERYGLTRAVIAEAAEGYITVLLDRKFRECSGLIYDAPPSTAMRRFSSEEKRELIEDITTCFQGLHEVTSQLCAYGRGIMIGREQRCAELYDENYRLTEKARQLVPIAFPYLVEHMTKNLYDSLILEEKSEASIAKGEKIVDILDTMKNKFLSKVPLAELIPTLYKKAVVLNEIAQMSFDQNMVAKAVELSRKALETNLEMGDISMKHSDYETLVMGRIRSYGQLGMFLSFNNDEEGVVFSKLAVDLADSFYHSTAREQSRNGELLIEMMVNYVQLMPPQSPEKLDIINKIRQMSTELGFGISDELGKMLSREEYMISKSEYADL